MTEATPLTDELLAEEQQRLHAATPGPWTYSARSLQFDVPAMVKSDFVKRGHQHQRRCLGRICEVTDDAGRFGSDVESDVAFIAHAPTDEARLIAEVRRLRAELADVKTGYDDLNRNWSAVHNAFSSAIREACGMPEATVPELCDQIVACRQQSPATDERG